MQVKVLVFPNIPWQPNWDSLIGLGDNYQQQFKVTKVSWENLAIGICKLNTDGSALQNSGKVGGGGILRDHQGIFIYAFSISLGFGTNNFSEIKVPLHGLD